MQGSCLSRYLLAEATQWQTSRPCLIGVSAASTVISVTSAADAILGGTCQLCRFQGFDAHVSGRLHRGRGVENIAILGQGPR